MGQDELAIGLLEPLGELDQKLIDHEKFSTQVSPPPSLPGLTDPLPLRLPLRFAMLKLRSTMLNLSCWLRAPRMGDRRRRKRSNRVEEEEEHKRGGSDGRGGQEPEAIRNKLREMKAAAGGRTTPYALGFNPTQQGCFKLYWLPGSRLFPPLAPPSRPRCSSDSSSLHRALRQIASCGGGVRPGGARARSVD